MAVTVLLIRHGETAWNRKKLFRGYHDIALNENGRAQGRDLGKALAARAVAAAYSSPLSRSLETAKIALKRRKIEPVVHPGLMDINYGEWTGLEESVVAGKWPEIYARWRAEPHKVRPPGGDSLNEIYDKAFGALRWIEERHEGETIAVFAHRVVNKLLILGMLSLGLERFNFIRQDNGCINEFQRVEAGYIVVRLNDTSHIRKSSGELLQEDF